MKLANSLRKRAPLIALLTPVLLLVVVGPFVENSNAVKAAERQQASELRVTVAAEERAERAAEREAELVVMTCDELHSERASVAQQFDYSVLLQRFDEAFEGHDPGDNISEIENALAHSVESLREAPAHHTAPIDAQIEARCPTS